MTLPCNAKIVATLGPASADRATIEALVRAGADVFRLNFSHGTHADHQQRLALIRSIEADIGRPIGVLLDLQGPKLRVGTFANGPVKLVEGAPFRLDLDRDEPGDAHPGAAAASGDLRGAEAGRRTAARRWAASAEGRELRTRLRRDARRQRRPAVRPQGRERAGCRAAAVGDDRQGPRRPRLRPDAGHRLGRAVLRAARRPTSPRPRRSSRAVPASSPSWRSPRRSNASTRSWP